MKKLITTLTIVLIAITTFGQFPINEEFDPGTTWAFTNGAGIQNYGGGENYGTFNVGNTPYPNSSTILITSPVLDLSTCVEGLSISFELYGLIERNRDFVYFEYYDSGSWNVVGTYTGRQNNFYSFETIPNSATRLRFRMETSRFNNSIGNFLYFYDITSVHISCSGILPVEMLDMNVYNENNTNIVEWTTASEINNDYFLIERSTDGFNWSTIATVDGSGNTTTEITYRAEDNSYGAGINYYRIKQVDFDGQYEYFDIMSIKNVVVQKREIGRWNLSGQKISKSQYHTQTQPYIVRYSDGTSKTIKIIRQ